MICSAYGCVREGVGCAICAYIFALRTYWVPDINLAKLPRTGCFPFTVPGKFRYAPKTEVLVRPNFSLLDRLAFASPLPMTDEDRSILEQSSRPQVDLEFDPDAGSPPIGSGLTGQEKCRANVTPRALKFDIVIVLQPTTRSQMQGGPPPPRTTTESDAAVKF
ncbi:hypothetical protein J3R82DRAFT_6368 [Butyriboletus roseoflavus]|nr:hypothetical protein J3R82DRAFT_6368 [Butyriboletus roseoflavus]